MQTFKYGVLCALFFGLPVCGYWASRRLNARMSSSVLCGHKIAYRDRRRFAGMVVAVDPASSAIIEADRKHGSLRSTMRERHLGRLYEIVQIPPLEPV